MRTKLDSSTPHLGGDGGGLLFIAFALALILMLLASCRSKQVTINEQVDSVVAKAFSLADIRRQMLDFSFDSMEIVTDTCSWTEVKGRSCRVRVMGGKIKSHSEQSSVVEQRDSMRVQTEYQAEKIVKPPERNWRICILGIAFVLAIVLGAIMAYKIRHHLSQ